VIPSTVEAMDEVLVMQRGGSGRRPSPGTPGGGLPRDPDLMDEYHREAVANIRGGDLADAMAYIQDTYGREALDRVMAALDPETRDSFDTLRSVSWYPLSFLTSFLVLSKQLLDPSDASFYRKQGYDAGQRQRSGPLGVMVATPLLRMRLASTAWRMFYDVGRLEVVGDSPETAVGQIHDFPTTPELCERFQGIWGGIASTKAVAARAEESRCVLRGDPYCELRIRYDPTP